MADEPIPVIPQRGRRSGISAEVAAPPSGPLEKKVFPKSEEEKARLKEYIRQNILFAHLNSNELNEVVDAFFPVVHESGAQIIKQGQEGDNFYIIDEGQCEVYVSIKGAPPIKVQDRGPGGSFGELALMYNAARAATVSAITRVRLWALDRVTFNHILRSSGESKLTTYVSFLSKIKLLQALGQQEFQLLADALREEEFAPGTRIVTQGEPGEQFYIVLEGSCVAERELGDGSKQQLMVFTEGQCFGERALLTNEPRAANVYAQTQVKLGCIERQTFEGLLGPCEDVLRSHMQEMGYTGIGGGGGEQYDPAAAVGSDI